MIHVEFLGIPGSGKSTLHRSVITELKKNELSVFDDEQAMYEGIRRQIGQPYSSILNYIPYYPVRKNILRVYGSLSDLNSLAYVDFLTENPEFASNLFSAIGSQQSTKRRTRLGKWLFQLVAGYAIASNNLYSDEFLVIDEGFSHRATSLFYHDSYTGPDEPFDQYLNSMPKPDILFVIDCSIDTCFERLTKQGGFPYRFKNKNEKMKKEFLRGTEDYIYSVRESLSDRGVDVRTIDNEGTVTSSVESILEIVDNKYSR